MNEIRKDIPEPPARMKRLPIDERGYPVPWFVSWIDGKPEFRIADARKLALAVRDKRCWVCGELLGRNFTFVIGPMCSVNLISSEPPSHRECAEYSVVACPFLVKPQMVRREKGIPEEADCAGTMIEHNPGVSLLWDTRKYKVQVEKVGVLFHLGEPTEIRCYAKGRRATEQEVRESIDRGLPRLIEAASQDGSLQELMKAKDLAMERLGL